jgi:hypothetical protein
VEAKVSKKVKAKVTEKISEEVTEVVESKVTEPEAPKAEPVVETPSEAEAAPSKVETAPSEVETAPSEVKTAPKPQEPVDEEITPAQQAPQTESAPVTAQPRTVPSAPRNLTAKQVKVDSVTLTWDVPENTGNAAMTSYLVVMREADKNKFKKVGHTDGATLQLNVSKVKEGHEYYFRVYAENEVGISEEMADLGSSVKIPSREAVEEEVTAIVEKPKEVWKYYSVKPGERGHPHGIHVPPHHFIMINYIFCCILDNFILLQ